MIPQTHNTAGWLTLPSFVARLASEKRVPVAPKQIVKRANIHQPCTTLETTLIDLTKGKESLRLSAQVILMISWKVVDGVAHLEWDRHCGFSLSIVSLFNYFFD